MRLDQVFTKNQCEVCKHIFVANTAKVVPIINIDPFREIKALLVAINGELIWSSAKLGDRALACPKCEAIHPMGFDSAPTDEDKLPSIILDL